MSPQTTNEQFSTWESYFYPETYDPKTGHGTLQNKKGYRDSAVLHVFEYGATVGRQKQLEADPSLIQQTFDASHIRAIHAYLFQDVYEWAGQYRSVNMAKAASRFARVDNGEIDRYLADVHRLVSQTPWAQLDHSHFGTQAATVFAYLNQAHPFREGNGRASKVFMQQVADRSLFRLDYSIVSPRSWNQASMLSGPDLGSYIPVPDTLVPIFRQIAIPRPAGTQPVKQNQALYMSLTAPTSQIARAAPRPSPARPNRYGRSGSALQR